MSGDTVERRMERWFCGNADAVSFGMLLWDAAQAWDDVADEGASAHTGGLLSWLAFGKEYHPFFEPNSRILRPVMLSVHLQWTAANVLDHGSEDDLAKAYMLRAGLYGVWHVMAWITGGEAHAREVGPEIYRTYGETVASIAEELSDA